MKDYQIIIPENLQRYLCRDCGSPYDQHGVDVRFPDFQWAEIASPDYPGNMGLGSGLLLCGTCIARRAVKRGFIGIQAILIDRESPPEWTCEHCGCPWYELTPHEHEYRLTTDGRP